MDTPEPAPPVLHQGSGHTEPQKKSNTPAPWPGAGRSCVYLGRQTSFVTLTYCCQEPKNTFINGKTGMAPQRNILTSPEEPAGGFRAHPQEAWVSYLLGSPPGGGRATRFSQRHACPGPAWGSKAWLPRLDCAEMDFCDMAWSTPYSTYSPPGYCPVQVFSLVTISSDGQ